MAVEARKILMEEQRRTVADQSYVSALIRKWGDFLEGMPSRTEADRYNLGVTAILMENESQYLQGMNEETRQANVGPFTKFIFPVLRRVFPSLIANDLVSVQPMNAPIGAVFYLNYKYGTAKGVTAQGTTFPSQTDFDRDYSSEYINGEQLVTGDGTKYGGAGTAIPDMAVAFTPVRPLNSERGFKVEIREMHPTTGATIQSAVDNGSGGFTGDAAAGTFNYTTGTLTGFKFTNAPANGSLVKAFYFYDGELNTRIPQINLDVQKTPVEAVPRRLKAVWSSEAAEDLKAFHGLDAETEIVSAIAQEIALEIDREIIQALMASATGTTGTWDRIPPSGVNELDHLRSMLTTLSTISNLIHKKTLRRPANWIVTSPEISALITQLTTHGDFRPMWAGGMAPTDPSDYPTPPSTNGAFSIYKVGTLMHKWAVYEDPFFQKDQMLIGLKGDSFLDAGYVFAPYIPLQVTPTFMDPNDFGMRKGLRTRYATKMLRPEFYGSMRITNL